MATLAEPIVHGQPVESGLKTNTLTLFDTTVIATSSVAPAYTLAATAAFLIVGGRPRVARRDPRGIPAGALHRHRVLLPEPAGSQLRRVVLVGQPDAQPLHRLGVRAGFSWLANVLFCAAAPLVAGAYTLQLLNSFGWISSDAANDNRLIAVVGVLWLLLVTFMVARGIRVTANFQWVLVFIEYLIVLAFAALGHRQDRRRPPRCKRRSPPTGSTRCSCTTSTVSRPGRRWRCSSSGVGTPRRT